MGTEADTSRTLITPKLQAAGWEDEPHFLNRPFNLPPISHHGNVNEIIGKFNGADRLRNAVNQLQSLLYAT